MTKKSEFDAWWVEDTLTVEWYRVPSFAECKRILDEVVLSRLGFLVEHILPSGTKLVGFYGDMGRLTWLHCSRFKKDAEQYS